MIIILFVGSNNWLQLCEISVSPIADIIAIAKERKIVILTSRWNNNSIINQFEITYSGSIHDYDKVKSVLCLPVVEQNGKSIVGTDWTCILIGFDSGYVRFYTEDCQFLFEEQFHSENITSVKCQSQHGPRPDISLNLKPEEIYIQYQSNIVVLDAIQLFTYLRNCRSQLIRGKSFCYIYYLATIGQKLFKRNHKYTNWNNANYIYFSIAVLYFYKHYLYWTILVFLENKIQSLLVIDIWYNSV